MQDSLERLTQALANRYAIKGELGRGGMATVYRVRDLKHDREVAMKVFHPEVASVIGADRFLQEIRVTANLQHPHILPLFDSGFESGFLFYVMPLVEGESVRDLLNRERQLPVETAVRITREVASALDYAHRHSIVHRDIKPENILVHDGQALVADFGIALAATSAAGSRLTQTGLSLGTPLYMSPEQASGERVIDGRTDVYSLCAVLYEMLVGSPPFEGTSAQALVARIMTEPLPDVRKRRVTVPVEVALALERGLARLPADRFQSAKDLADALSGGTRLIAPVVTPPSRRASRALLAVGFALGILTGIVGSWMVMRPASRAGLELVPTVRLTVNLPADAPLIPDELSNLALSHDGSRLVYVADAPDGPALFLRNLSEMGFAVLRGTDNARGPFFSPDGTLVGFFADGKLRKVSSRGGASVDLADAALPRGAEWTAAGSIVFTSAPGSGFWSVPDSGGKPSVVTRLDSMQGERTHRFPEVDNEGRILATIRTSAHPSFDQAGIAVFSADGTTRRELINGGSQPRLLPNDVLIFVRGNTLYGVRLSPDHGSRVGEPVALVDSVMTDPSTGAAQYTVSENGTLVYVVGGQWRPARMLTRLQRGSAVRLADDIRPFNGPRMSPDGRRIAVVIEDANDDIWLYDAGGGARRLTFEAGSHIAPVWDPAGSRIAYSSNVAGHYNVYIRPTSGSGTPQRLAPSEDSQFPSGWTPDGKRLAFTASSIATGYDIQVSDIASGETQSFLSSTFNEYGAVFSPDGKWASYVSDETGREEVYLRSYPDGGSQLQISSGGGTNPLWSRDGRQLYYRRGSDLMVRDVVSGAVKPSSARVLGAGILAPGRVTPVASFDIHPQGGVVVASDDRRALPTALRVVTGWLTEVNARLR